MNNQLTLLSKYRTQLMGFAMLLILIFHTTIDISNINILKNLKNIGNVGVDIFLLLSGLGLYFSYSKKNNKIKFYKKRFLRILPTFILVATLWYFAYSILHNTNFIYIFWGITSLDFFVYGNLTFWFISAILLLYIITPIYIDLMNKNPKFITLLTINIFIFLGLIIKFTFLNLYFGHLLIFLCRVPIFLIGIYIGNLIQNMYEIKINLFFIYIVSFISLMFNILIFNSNYISIPFTLKYYTYIPLSFGTCITLSQFLYKLDQKNIKTNHILLTFLGTYSLEMYLLHERILLILTYSEKFIIIDKYHIILNLLAIFISMIASYILSKVVIWICSKFINSKLVIKYN